MAKRFLVFLCFLIPAMGQDKTFWIPQFGHGGPDFGLTTEITLVNLSNGILNPGVAEISTYDVDGNPSELLDYNSPFEPSVSTVSKIGAQMGALGAAVVRSNSVDPGMFNLGWARVDTRFDLAVEVLFNIINAAGQVVSSTTVLPRPLTREATLIVNVDPTVLTNLAILNPPDNDEAAVVDLVVFDQFGDQVASGQVDNLRPGQRIARSIVELLPELAGRQGFLGTASIASNVPVSILPLRQAGLELSTQETLAGRPAPIY